MKKRILSILFSIFLCIFFMQQGTSLCFAQHIRSFALDLDQMTINSIFCLYQDKTGYLWLGTPEGVMRYDGYNMKIIRNDYKTPDKLSNNDIRCITEDKDYIWVGSFNGISLIDKNTLKTEVLQDVNLRNIVVSAFFPRPDNTMWIIDDHSLYLYDYHNKVFKDYHLPKAANSIYCDRKGDFWLLGDDGAIFKYNNERDYFGQVAKLKDFKLRKLIQDAQGDYWIITWGNGIWRFNLDAKSEEEMFVKQNIINPVRKKSEEVFYDIVQDDYYGYIWALSHFNLYIFEKNAEGRLVSVDAKDIPTVGGGLIDTHKSYSSIQKTAHGDLILGAFDQGICVEFSDNEVDNFILDEIPGRIGLDANVIYINKDRNGTVWFDQVRYGVCLYDEKTGKITYGVDGYDNLYSIDACYFEQAANDNEMWASGRELNASKIWRMAANDMRVSVKEFFDLNDVCLDPGPVVRLVCDDENRLWACTYRYLFKKKDSSEMERMPLAIDELQDMASDKNGYLWLCGGKGVYKIMQTDKPSIVQHFDLENLNLKDREIPIRICADAVGNVFFGTSLGRVFHYDTGTEALTDYTDSLGLNGGGILRLLIDDDYFWVMSNKEMVAYDLNAGTVKNYFSDKDRIHITSFRYGASFLDSEGNCYVGGHKGYVRINKDRMTKQYNQLFDVRITDVEVEGRSVFFYPEENEDNTIDQITLSPDAEDIEILFSSFNYQEARRIRYAYKMEGFDHNWHFAEDGSSVAHYNHLPKGTFRFHVKSTDPNGVWNDKEAIITIERLPDWYETWWAYLLYSLLVIMAIVAVVLAYKSHLKQKNQVKLREELSQIKLTYFTNVSHELLTPLTLISCVADALEKGSDNLSDHIDSLRSNVERLKRLLQQALDFRKVESGKMQLNVRKGNISAMVMEIVAATFQPLAHRKGLFLTCDIADGIWGYIDFDKLDKVLYNLLSNAIKYTPEGKMVHVLMNAENREGCRFLVLKVQDEGVGIKSSELDKIFNRFYNGRHQLQVESNGIGLSLTKELITIHKGSIEVESKYGKGTTFVVELPIDKMVYSETDLVDSKAENPDDKMQQMNVAPETNAVVLYIDDNAELRKLMADILGKHYKFITADGGLEGLKIVKTTPVDVIICDLMMPGMDGFEFCKELKSNPQTNFIPIIMLTAYQDIQNRVKSYQVGADSYITKPFDMKVLQARLDNLIEMNNSRQHQFRQQMEVNIDNLDYQAPDEEFLNMAIACVEKHLQEPEFNMVQMAEELNLSRSTLSRKIKVLTGLTPLDFVRNIKMKYACKLLKNKSANISDVAYTLGFSTPKYFTKTFKEVFGMTPTEFQEKDETK